MGVLRGEDEIENGNILAQSILGAKKREEFRKGLLEIFQTF